MIVKVNPYKDIILRNKDKFKNFLEEHDLRVKFVILETTYYFGFYNFTGIIHYNLIFKYDGYILMDEEIAMLFSLLFS